MAKQPNNNEIIAVMKNENHNLKWSTQKKTGCKQKKSIKEII